MKRTSGENPRGWGKAAKKETAIEWRPGHRKQKKNSRAGEEAKHGSVGVRRGGGLHGPPGKKCNEQFLPFLKNTGGGKYAPTRPGGRGVSRRKTDFGNQSEPRGFQKVVLQNPRRGANLKKNQQDDSEKERVFDGAFRKGKMSFKEAIQLGKDGLPTRCGKKKTGCFRVSTKLGHWGGHKHKLSFLQSKTRIRESRLQST